MFSFFVSVARVFNFGLQRKGMAAVFGTCLDSTENLYKSPGQNRDTLYQINPVDKILIFFVLAVYF